MKSRGVLFLIAILYLSLTQSQAQVTYQPKNSDGFSIGSYGRVGVDWSFENGGSIGRRLNLNNMGSIGGRMEEQDYLEVAPIFLFKPFKADDPTQIKVQTRLSVYSRSLALFGNSSTSSLGGLTIALPEIYAEASNINGKDLTLWIGSRFDRKGEVQIADHFYFDDHSGQGFGIGIKNTRFSSIFVSSTDTTSDVPPYFFLNIGDGVANIALRQRVVFVLEQDIDISESSVLTGMFEYHRMGDVQNDEVPTPYDEESGIILNYPSDYGLVFGLKWNTSISKTDPVAFNHFSVRYGTRLANGGDGGHSKTWMTFGAPDLEKLNFAGAYSLSLVDEVKFDLNENNNLNAYLIYTQSKGAADSNGKAKTYLGREIYNRKKDFSVGFRETYFVNPKFHFLSELHYSMRKDGEDDTYSFQKISLAPTFVPTGMKSTGARPHFRFVCSVAHYNNAAKENLYSPYLQFVGKKNWGYYFGVKMEWWI
ncbi:carbohydrate porin [Maribellus sediminis]|uniref:carbohydrate porin n=1 Tax=Maribellus sediminis TaxID=2696285 RepID=UPI001431AA56|nr:carbohydrate porin [Maribellus sediminis]